MKWKIALIILLTLIMNAFTGYSVLAEREDAVSSHKPFIIKKGISEEEYNLQKSLFCGQLLLEDNVGTGRKSLLSAQSKSASQSGNKLSNEYIEFAVESSNGRFTIGTVKGNPSITSDNNQIMLYGHSSPSTSYTTVNVNGTAYIYGDSGFDSDPHFDGDSNLSEAFFDGIRVKQVISIVKNSSTQRDDIVEVKYIATNTGTTAQSFGLRIMLDTMLGSNDAAPFRVPGYGDLTTEKEFSGSNIPQYWQAFDSLTNPKVVSYGNFVSGAIIPNKVQFSNWRNVFNTPWNYHVSEGSSNGDSAVSIIWERTLAAGAQETYVTRYGLSELLQDMQPPLGLTIASGSSILRNAANDDYLPYTITAYVQNVGTATAENVTCTIELPQELAFVDSGETGIVTLGSMTVGQVKTVEKVVKVKNKQTQDITTQFHVNVSAKNAANKRLTKDVTIGAVVFAWKSKFKYGGYINQQHDSSATYYYSDSYFNGNASDPNPHLATMSLCLELSSWSSWDAIRDPKTGKLKSDWNKEAWRNASNLFNDIGFQDFEYNDYWNAKPQMHSVGVIAAYKNIGESTVVALVVRGGGYFDEWGGDFVLGRSGNHEGFQKARNEAYRFLESYIEKHKNNNDFKSVLKLWIVGYSRGGATANMLAGMLTDAGSCGGFQLKQNNIFCHTFEAPQGYVGLDSKKYSNIQNHVNKMDIVPLVAPMVWGFIRYNTNSDDLILASLGTKTYNNRVNAIRTLYSKVLEGVPNNGRDNSGDAYSGSIAFLPNPYASKIDLSIEGVELKWMFVPPYVVYLEPKVSWTSRDMSLPIDSMLVSNINSIFTNMQGSSISDKRNGFVNDVENALSHLCAFFMGYNNKIKWGPVLYDAFFNNYAEGAREIAGILINPVLQPKSKKILTAAEAATKRISDSALKQTGTNLNEVKTMLVSFLKTLFNTAIDDPQGFFGFLYYLVGDNGIQHHWPEISLAAMMSYDSYYTSTAFAVDYPQSYRLCLFNCPIDISVYDENNQLISEIKGETVNNNNSVHGASISENGTKQVILPSDAAYTIDINSTDDGEMSVSVFEYNSTLNQYTLLQGYQDILLSKGDAYKLIIPEFIRMDYVDVEGDGSISPYQLIGPSDRTIEPTIKITGENIKYHHVTLSSNNDKGIVTGGGDFVVSSFAEIKAIPMPTVEFLGWYVNGKLVSEEADYRFAVNQDLELIAKFSEGDFHKLSVKTTAGGTVNVDEMEIPASVEIQLTAEPNAGSQFVEWQTTAGHLQNENDSTTVFTMPNMDTVVTAVFKNNSISIMQQPTDQYVVVGQRATFKVMVEGEGLKYQWYINRNGGKGWKPIDGAIGAEYVTAQVELSNDGYQYYCLVTDANGNTVQSNIAVLHVREYPGGPGTPEIPETGDPSKPNLWLLMVIIGVIGLLLQKRKGRLIR